jgi:trehalose-6-phosphate synthase
MEHWTEQKLQDLIVERLDGRKLIAVSNREPYIHTRENGKVRCSTPASGMTSAIDPMLRASGGVWVANGTGDADRETVDRRNRVRVPPEAPSYTLRRVWLPARIADEYYNGMANEGLWPLCHNAFHRPHFNLKHWNSYRKANETFAEAVLDEAGGQPAVIFIQDYHLALLPRMLKRENPSLTIAQFWHIPWPNRETFQAFPWKEELLDGLLGNDLLGFHVRQHCTNFLDTVDWSLESLVDLERGTVSRGGHTTTVRPFPIGIDAAGQAQLAASQEAAEAETGWRKVLGGTPELLGIGIDRIDYTKGIPDRLEALDRLLEERPEYVGRLTFLQVGVPSRTAVGDYEDLNAELVAQVERLNRKWSRGAWKPLVLVRRNVDQCDLAALHLMADFCIVSSLHDGMNLVAKEFVASRIDGDGVLILSEFTGAARELADAVIVNPFSVDEMAEAMFRALEMPAHERRRRMNRMRAVVSVNNVYRWAGKLIGALSAIDAGVVETGRTQTAGGPLYLAGVA